MLPTQARRAAAQAVKSATKGAQGNLLNQGAKRDPVCLTLSSDGCSFDPPSKDTS